MTAEPAPAPETDTAARPMVEQLELDLYQQPPEDGGAPTRGNYHFQDEVLAWFCFTMHTDPSIIKFVCEWHEDFVIVRDRRPYLDRTLHHANRSIAVVGDPLPRRLARSREH